MLHSWKRGFTLIELLITIAVLGILVSVLVVTINVPAQLGKGRDSQRKADLHTIQTALEQYNHDAGVYPTPIAGTTSLPSPLVYATQQSTFLPQVPIDPLGTADTNWNGGQYYYYSDGSNYLLVSCLENGADNTTDVTSTPPNGVPLTNCTSGKYEEVYSGTTIAVVLPTLVPTATPTTAIPPTNTPTPIVPTATPTNVPTPTITPIPVPTNTPTPTNIPPTPTPMSGATIYLRNIPHPTVNVLPSGFFYYGNTSNYTGSGAQTLSTAAGTSQDSLSPIATLPGGKCVSVNTGYSAGVGQWISPPMTAQTISAGTWTVGIGIAWPMGYAYEPSAHIILVNGSTGALRVGISSPQKQGIFGASRLGTETTGYTTMNGSAMTVYDGDYLVFEDGAANLSSPATPVCVGSMAGYADGTGVISSDNIVTSNAKSFFTAPQILTFKSLAQVMQSNNLAFGKQNSIQTVLGASTVAGCPINWNFIPCEIAKFIKKAETRKL